MSRKDFNRAQVLSQFVRAVVDGDASPAQLAQKVSLRTRAFPLFEMLEAAAREQVPVMWSDETAGTEG